MSLYEQLADLPLTIETFELDPLQQAIPGDSEMLRHTTVIHMQGKGATGMGEDVTYSPDDQLVFQSSGIHLDIAGAYTIDSFSQKLDELELFEMPPQQEAYRNYRRWAFESAALSLALCQAGTSLADVLNREVYPLNFVNSLRINDPTSAREIHDRLAMYPDLRFKLDPTPEWTDQLIAELAKTNAIDTIDLKGHYKGTSVDVKTDPVLYRKLVEAFPDTWIEDPDVNTDTRPTLEPHANRITWDAPIHSIADIESMQFSPPKMINMKPSRFGTLQSLFDTYDYCISRSIGMYGGGQFELGVGRTQIQYLAAMFHPDTPNDVAPKAYNAAVLPVGLPISPITVTRF